MTLSYACKCFLSNILSKQDLLSILIEKIYSNIANTLISNHNTKTVISSIHLIFFNTLIN